MIRALLSFDTLLTPAYVRFLFYLGVVASCIAALGVVITGLGMMNNPYLGSAGKLGGLGVIVLAPVAALIGIFFARLGAELVLLPFMIRDELAWQRENREIAPHKLAAE